MKGQNKSTHCAVLVGRFNWSSILQLVLTGILKVAEPLDHELAREYFLTILARDHGSPPLSNTAIISINITDVNDNPPRFSQDAYSTVVNEMIAEGTEVFKVRYCTSLQFKWKKCHC